MSSGLIFFTVFIIFMGFIFYAIFSKRGRRFGPKLIFGGNIVQEFGEIAKYPIPLGSQALSLYGLEKGAEKFLVVEVRTIMPISVSVSWVKITDETLKTINSHVELK
jgi:hypothetical protein